VDPFAGVDACAWCAAGGGMGVMMGLLFGALEQPLNVEEMTLRQQLTYGVKSMGSRSWHMAKTFAVMGPSFPFPSAS